MLVRYEMPHEHEGKGTSLSVSLSKGTKSQLESCTLALFALLHKFRDCTPVIHLLLSIEVPDDRLSPSYASNAMRRKDQLLN